MCKHDGIFYVKNDKENVMKAFQSLNFVVNHVNQKDRENGVGEHQVIRRSRSEKM